MKTQKQIEIPKTMTGPEVEKLLHVTGETVRKYRRSGKFRAMKISSRKILYFRSDVENFLDSCRMEGQNENC